MNAKSQVIDYKFITCQRGQAVVEAAVTLPVILIMVLIIFNVCRYVNAVSQFDMSAGHVIIKNAASPADEDSRNTAQHIQEDLQASLQHISYADVRVQSSVYHGHISQGNFSLPGQLTLYTAYLDYKPWPSSVGFGNFVFNFPHITSHAYQIIVDPYRVGIVK